MKFPNLIHVTYETPEHDDPFLMVQASGITGVYEQGQPIAIYKRVQVGKVDIKKSFVKAERGGNGKRKVRRKKKA